METFEKFYKESFFFPYLLDLGGSIRSVSYLGDLWFRESFLERARCIQVGQGFTARNSKL